MKFHKQIHTIKPEPNAPHGSCYPTVLACLLEIELQDTLHFNLLFFRPEQVQKMTAYYRQMFLDLPYDEAEDWQKSNYDQAVHRIDTIWYKAMELWLLSMGKVEVPIYDIKKWLKTNDGPYLVTGRSPRVVSHVVIYQKGARLHDPHPSNDYLLPEDEDNRYSYSHITTI